MPDNSRCCFLISVYHPSQTKKCPSPRLLHLKVYFDLSMLTLLTYFSAAWQTVPQVSAMSSTSIAILSFTSPTNTMDDTSFAFLRSLWIKAKSTFSLSPIDVTLENQRQLKCSFWKCRNKASLSWFKCHASPHSLFNADIK